MKKYLLILVILLASFLRLYKLNSVPVSLYWDEVSLGYNAFSILKTGHDEHGVFMPLTNFAAFGDYKPPLYIYASVPSIALFGLNEFAVRFPSAFFGILTVLVTYLITRKITQNETISLLAALFLAISPWHLQFSRGAFEGNLGLFFSTLGIYLFFLIPKNKWFLLLSLLSFDAAVYTFTGQRLFVPLIMVALFIQFRKELFKNLKFTVISTLIFLIIFWPIFRFATSTVEGKSRFNEVTIFNDLAPSQESAKYRTQDDFSWWSNIIHNRRVDYAYQYLIHYFDAFNPSFLFSHGDVNPRLSSQETGELYYFDLPLILSGAYFLFRKKNKYAVFLITWLLISPLGPATARETPHALRMIHILPTFQILSAVGIYYLYQALRYKRAFVFSTTAIILLSFLYYLETYYTHWPVGYAGSWQYGYKQMVETVKPLYDKEGNIIVSNYLGRGYIYFLFYMQTDPPFYWQTRNVYRDNFAFIHVNGFDKLHFVDGNDKIDLKGNTLVVMPKGQTPSNANIINLIKDPKGETIFEISQVNN